MTEAVGGPRQEHPAALGSAGLRKVSRTARAEASRLDPRQRSVLEGQGLPQALRPEVEEPLLDAHDPTGAAHEAAVAPSPTGLPDHDALGALVGLAADLGDTLERVGGADDPPATAKESGSLRAPEERRGAQQKRREQ